MNLMFQPQFEPLIVSGRKYHTIRPPRKIPLRVGQPLSLRVWTGKPYRSPQRRFHETDVKKIAAIVIDEAGTIKMDGVPLTNAEAASLAWHDGFENQEALRTWFFATHGLPFTGEIIYWKNV
jgi:hypothetical protein